MEGHSWLPEIFLSNRVILRCVFYRRAATLYFVKKTLQTPFARGFQAVGDPLPRWLVLGSLPGVKSLQEQAYYAHPRNAFWPIMAALFELDIETSYAERYRQLAAVRIMLWDVVHSGHRAGSLDTAISRDSMQINDFDFLTSDSGVEAVICNGTKAYDLFVRHVAKPRQLTLPILKMASTSPANARLSKPEKIASWRENWPF